MGTLRRPGVVCLAACALLAAGSGRSGESPGEMLYRHGVLPSGGALQAHREGGSLQGAEAACSNCHRRSGLGSSEGRISIPPIAAPYLFTPRGTSLEELGIPFIDTARLEHQPYDEATLARAVRDGLSADGRELNYLMPRYQLSDADMALLSDYLKSLRVTPPPGVTPSVLHFATIIAADTAPERRSAMLDVLNQYFADKNAAARAKTPTLFSAHRMMFRVQRHWQLHVWQLHGAPSSWEGQLRSLYEAQPVFAVLSGLAGSHWEPVQHFCETQRLPCLFPNVEAPPGSDADFYSVYFSRGVLLEARVIAAQLQQRPAVHRVLQIYRADDVGERAAHALRVALAADDRHSVEYALRGSAGTTDLAPLLRTLAAGDVLVLWLRPADLAALRSVATPPGPVWLSGEMAGLEQAPLPPAWRDVARMTYPVDLPGRRVVRTDYALSWFRIRRVAVTAPKLQIDTYLACGLLSETLNHMVDAFIRDYLIERIEMDLDHRALTGYYPRLTLAPNQRYASKGAYVVRFSDGQGTRVTPVSDWLVP